jgi:hypothetical protein
LQNHQDKLLRLETQLSTVLAQNPAQLVQDALKAMPQPGIQSYSSPEQDNGVLHALEDRVDQLAAKLSSFGAHTIAPTFDLTAIDKMQYGYVGHNRLQNRV